MVGARGALPRFLILFSLLTVFLICNAKMSTLAAQDDIEKKVLSLSAEDPIPMDPEVEVGSFSNGLRYYIRYNKKPEKRALLWLVIDAGSVLEDDDQQGLAHFTEHMAFNGTENFPKQDLIDYMESIGMAFGSSVSASTSFDRTFYRLEVPTDSAAAVETAFQILEDWAHRVSFEEGEIEKERGVVIEEWRLGLGARQRMLDKQLPILFDGSRYAERLPIGKKDIIESFDHETLRRFYRDWYRPDLMAVIVVGDFEKEWIRSLIEKHFKSIPASEQRRERPVFPVPDHNNVLFAVATDPEATYTAVTVCYKRDVEPNETIDDFKQWLVKFLHRVIFNYRLLELSEKADPPFLRASSGEGHWVRSKDAFTIGASVTEDGIELGLATLMTEVLRVKRHGFTETELERAKERVLRIRQKWYDERDKVHSQMYAGKCMSHFLRNEPNPGFSVELALFKRLLPSITLNEVNGLFDRLMTDENRVILISAPEREETVLPSEEKLLSIFKEVEKQEIQPYIDEVAGEPLIEKEPEAGSIVGEKRIEEIGITEWALSNGATVVLKPTDFDNDRIEFRAMSPGGISLVSDEDVISARHACWIMNESGLDGFSDADLRKKLAGEIVNVSPYMSELAEGLDGGCSTKDVETLFQLIYLAVTSPRKCPDTFQSYCIHLRESVENQQESPEAAFNDTIRATLVQYHKRRPIMTPEMVDEIDLDTAYRVYLDRFADVSEFVFIFAGNIDIEAIRPLVERYLASLPVTGRKETWLDHGIEPPEGIIKKAVHRGTEPKSLVSLTFTGPYEWSRDNNHTLDSMSRVLRIKLREVMREDMSSTYGVSVFSSGDRYPREKYEIHIRFGCEPDRVEELTAKVFEQIYSLKTFGPGDEYIAKVKEIQRREHEKRERMNNVWVRELVECYFTGGDPADFMKYPELVEALTGNTVQEAAQSYFNMDNYVRVVLFPESYKQEMKN